MSLFARLFKYRATDGRSPQEDFLTEALAGVLESSPPLRVAFVQWLVERDVETVRVETQKHAGSYGRLDLWLEAREHFGEHHVVVFENKIWTGEGENQLGRYEEYLRQQHAEAERRTLIYLTPHAQCDFEPSGPMVRFRELRWSQIFKWMKAWTQGPDTEARPIVLVNELLALMEEWNLTTELNASDLAAAVAHRLRVEEKMVALLWEVWSDCSVDGTQTRKWKYEKQHLYFTSPNIDGRSLYFEFGFDFNREDERWSVVDLQLPSAYFVVAGSDIEQIASLSSSWNDLPESWGWSDKGKVKLMDVLNVGGDSLHLAYLEFFNEALKEAEAAAGLA